MNAKEEFLIHTGLVTSNVNKIKCAEIQFGHDSYYLGTGWDKQEAKDFLDKIDFDYDNGYGTQNLYGVVWYEDGTWSDRGQYDGSEWWQHNVCPNIPKHLIRIDKERDSKINMILEDDTIQKK